MRSRPAKATTFPYRGARCRHRRRNKQRSDTISGVRDTEPDLLFLDIQMPGMDGFGVVDALGDMVPELSSSPHTTNTRFEPLRFTLLTIS